LKSSARFQAASFYKEFFTVQKKNKIAILVLPMLLGFLLSAFSQNLLGDLQDSTNKFADALAKSLPFNSTVGLNWSDAYIGQLIGMPPHLGVGVSGGIATMDYGVVEEMLKEFSISMPFSLNKMILPGYTAEVRIGGLILPFDGGFKVGILPGVNMGDNFKLDYTLVGGDIRYSLLRDRAALPKISLGFGINYLTGGIRSSVGGQSFSFGTSSPNTLSLDDSRVNLSWSTLTYDLKAQISKSFLILTPYLGLGTTYAQSRAGYAVDTQLRYNGAPVTDPAQIAADLEKAGISGIDFGARGFSSTHHSSGWGLRVFGGFSLNATVVKFDFTGMYSILDSNYGATMGVRFQL
jgi:hypothetical protein